MRRTALLVTVAAGVLASCGAGTTDAPGVECRPVVALVASSIRSAVLDTTVNPCAGEWKVTGGSSTALVAQVREGSPADVFVAAGDKAVSQLKADGLTEGEPVRLGSVRATLLVSARRDGDVSLGDLPRLVGEGWKVGVCVATAPCGSMADILLSNAAEVFGNGFTRQGLVTTEAASADELVMLVSTGELDAALIYEYVCEPGPDGQSSVRCVDIPYDWDGRALNPATPYFAVRLRGGESAESFMAFVSSAVFRSYLADRLRIR